MNHANKSQTNSGPSNLQYVNAEKFRADLEARNMTQGQAAQVLAINEVTLSRQLNRRRPPIPGLVERIEKIFNLPAGSMGCLAPRNSGVRR